MIHDTYRIIIAEDDASLATMFTRYILRLYPNAHIQVFDNGQDGLASYTEAGADLLVVNYSMPKMDGPTLARIIRARGDMVPIVGMSGDPYVRDTYLEAGADAFVEGIDLIKQLPVLLRPSCLHCPNPWQSVHRNHRTFSTL